jgi:hypothetical protein
MPRVNVYIPESLHARAKRAKLNLSELCQRAIDEELGRRDRRRALERFADELREQFGPATPDEIADAESWVDGVVEAAAPAHPPVAGVRARRSARRT